jgi:deoxycytidylate deaminase
MALLINADIKEIVVDDVIPYHELSLDMAQAANIKLRRFVL